jgi:hypothetical protein
MLTASQHTLQRQIRRRRLQPRGTSRTVRHDLRHASVSERLDNSRGTGESISLVLGAPIRRQQSLIRVDDLRRHQPVEQAPDAIQNSTGRYHRPTPQTQ